MFWIRLGIAGRPDSCTICELRWLSRICEGDTCRILTRPSISRQASGGEEVTSLDLHQRQEAVTSHSFAMLCYDLYSAHSDLYGHHSDSCDRFPTSPFGNHPMLCFAKTAVGAPRATTLIQNKVCRSYSIQVYRENSSAGRPATHRSVQGPASLRNGIRGFL